MASIFKPQPETNVTRTAAAAAARREHGCRFYVVTLLFADLPRWGDLIETIEVAGWHLEHFELAPEGHAVAVFRATEASS